MREIVIFDMDGTLIDSGEDITLSINYVRRRCYGLEPLSTQSVIDAINAPVRNLSEIFYGRVQYEEGAKTLFEEHYYDQCIRNVTPYEGIYDLLAAFEERGVVMGVATNAPAVFAKRMLEHLKMDSYFHLIVGADDVEKPKPHPEMLHRHLDYHRYRLGTDRAWMVGDNSKDMDAASEAGISGIFAGWGFARSGRGDYFAPSPETLLEIINTQGRKQ